VSFGCLLVTVWLRDVSNLFRKCNKNVNYRQRGFLGRRRCIYLRSNRWVITAHRLA
jgi:hypothetical protein